MTYMRIITLAVREFQVDNCVYRASFLTFHLLLSIVPVLAIAFGIAKGFGLDAILEKEITTIFNGQIKIVEMLIDFSRRLLDNTKGGIIAGFGILVLLFTVISVLGNIEHTFNKIWGVRKPRTTLRKITDYFSAVLIGTIFLIAYSSLMVAMFSQLSFFVQNNSLLNPFGSLMLFIFMQIRYIAVWILFAFIYIIMPNTEVKIKSGLTGGIIGGTLFLIVQWLYIKFQTGAVIYGAIYGGFAAFPLFLIWVYVSWMIVLLGAEISFASENAETFGFEPDFSLISFSSKKLLALKIMHLLVINFSSGEQSLSDIAISQKLEIPVRLVRQILYELLYVGIIAETINKNNLRSFQPSVDINNITIASVLDAVEQYRRADIPASHYHTSQKIALLLQDCSDTFQNSSSNIKLKDI
ncbi:MAG: YihY/virulence factor BrkB family protein [bacterium]